MRRVMIVGQPGAGKSTLARALGDITGLPVVHIDRIHWTPGWVARATADKDALCAEVHARDDWIFEGGHSKTWPERLARCDTLIWLDFPLPVRMARVLWRSLRYRGRNRPDLPDHCPERFDLTFYRWIFDTRRTARDNMLQLYRSAPPGKEKLRFSNARLVDGYLRRLRRERDKA